jgi:hypothetical protein
MISALVISATRLPAQALNLPALTADILLRLVTASSTRPH